MRVSTSQIYNIANVGMTQAQSSVTKTQEQMASGKKHLSPADDPVAAAGLLRLKTELSRIEQFGKNIDIAQNNLELEESTLASVETLLQRMRQIGIAAGNTAVLTADDYKAYAVEIETRIQELFNLQNTRNASGQYIFAGYQSGSPAFATDGGGNYSFAGDQGSMSVQVSALVSITAYDSGARVFEDIPSGHNTFRTRASESNQAVPPAIISVGNVVDQEAFDKLYPNDLKVTFNRSGTGEVTYDVTEQPSGKKLVMAEPYQAGQDIEVAGARFHIVGTPYAGEPAKPATFDFAGIAPMDFTGAARTITLQVGSQTETFTLDTNITSAAELATALGGTAENAAKLERLGLTVDANGLSSPSGANISLRSGSPETDTLFGVATQGQGTITTNGQRALEGDSFFAESTDKESILTTLSRMAQAMRAVENNSESKAELSKMVSKSVTNLTNAISNITVMQGEVGARLNTIESSKALNLDVKLSTQTVISSMESLDYADATIQLKMQTLVLEAAQQSFSKVSQLTLFNYL
ncbi:MAG: flagellar hook-associated protein FlgL [Cellvibrio sp.]